MHGRIFQTIDEVRDAVRAFAARYNAEWLIEKNGHLSPAAGAPPGTTRPSSAPRNPYLLSKQPGAVHGHHGQGVRSNSR